jgi:hypothetical protein
MIARRRRQDTEAFAAIASRGVDVVRTGQDVEEHVRIKDNGKWLDALLEHDGRGLGGTFTELALVSRDGSILVHHRIPTKIGWDRRHAGKPSSMRSGVCRTPAKS